MKALFRILVVLLLLGGWTVAAMSLHFVRSIDTASGKDRWFLIPKSRFGFTDTLVDVRAWTPADLPAHRALVERMIDAEKAHAFSHLVPESSRGSSEAMSAFLRSPTTAPTTQPQ